MTHEKAVSAKLEELGKLAPAGYALALQIEYSTPTFLFQTYPKAWVDYYSQNGLVMSDPTVAWGFSETGFRRWSDLSNADPAEVMTKAAKFGLNFGVTFSVETEGKRSLASFARSDRELTDAEIAALSSKVIALHDETGMIKATSPEMTAMLKKMSLQLTKNGKA